MDSTRDERLTDGEGNQKPREGVGPAGAAIWGRMWFMFPMKPVRIGRGSLRDLDLGQYTLEKKYDGHRAILVVEGGKKKLFTRQKNPIVVHEDLGGCLRALEMADGTVLDGEIWNPAKRGGWTSGPGSSLVFWDCVKDGGADIGLKPIEERRKALKRIVGDGNEGVRTVEVEEKFGEEMVEEVFRESLAVRKEARSRSGFVHGVVLKLRGSPRRDHATRTQEHPDWMKVVFDGTAGWG